jgi:hypothetical protein
MNPTKVIVIECDSCGTKLVFDECTKKEMFECTECSEVYSTEEEAEECCPENTEDVEVE